MVTINQQTCIGCAACVKDCLAKNISIEDGKAQVIREICMNCGHCIAVCPVNAVGMTDHDMSDVTELVPSTISPEDFLSLVKSRRSVRQYQDRPVEPAQLHRILEAARFTATAGNRQELSFVVVEREMEAFRALIIKQLEEISPELLAAEDTIPVLRNYATRWLAIAEKYRNNPQEKDAIFFGAPTVILITGATNIDAGMAVSNMELMAHANGLGALLSGFITRGAASAEVKELLGIPSDEKVLMAMLVGHPDVKYRRSVPRKPTKVTWH